MPRTLRFCNPGRFDRIIGLRKGTRTLDDAGGEVMTWVLNRMIWAHRRDMTGSERFRAQQEIAERAAVFTFGWFAELNAGDWQIEDDGLYWDIVGIAEPENTRRQFWEISATAIGI